MYKLMTYAFNLRLKYWENGISWFRPLEAFLTTRYHGIENRMIETFDYVTPENSNRTTHSLTFASILRDIGSVFDSAMREIIKNVDCNYVEDINGFLKCLVDYDPRLNERTITLAHNMKIIIPFQRSTTGIPEWWHAYNDMKHQELSKYYRGNFKYSLTALSALKLLHYSITQSINSRIFTNVGITYDSISEDELLFPSI